jgi:hypothetical protein
VQAEEAAVVDELLYCLQPPHLLERHRPLVCAKTKLGKQNYIILHKIT